MLEQSILTESIPAGNRNPKSETTENSETFELPPADFRFELKGLRDAVNFRESEGS